MHGHRWAQLVIGSGLFATVVSGHIPFILGTTTGVEITEKFCFSCQKVSNRSTYPSIFLPAPNCPRKKIFTCPLLFLPVIDKQIWHLVISIPDNRAQIYGKFLLSSGPLEVILQHFLNLLFLHNFY